MPNQNNHVAVNISHLTPIKHIKQYLSKLPSGQALEAYLQSYPIDKLDVLFATTIRLFDVFSSIFANGSFDPDPQFNSNNHHPTGVDSQDYGLSFYDRFMYKPSPDGTTFHPSATGIAISGAAAGLALLAGIGRSVYDIAHKNNLKSRKRLKTMMARHLTDEEMNEYLKLEEEAEARIKESTKQLASALNELRNIASEKNVGQEALNKVLKKIEAGQAALQKAKDTQGEQHKIQQAIHDASNAFNTTENAYRIDVDEKGRHHIQRVRGSVFNKPPRHKEAKPLKESIFSAIRQLDKHRYANRLAMPFTWLTNQSMWYWLAWFAALVIVGPIAIAAPPVMLGLALATAIIGVALSIWKGISRSALHIKHIDQRAKIIDILLRPHIVLDSTFKRSILTMHTYYHNHPAYASLKSNDKRASFLLRKYEKHSAADQANMDTTLKAWQSKTFMDFEHKQNLTKAENIRNTYGLHVQETAMADVAQGKGIREYLLSRTRKSRFTRHLYVISQVAAAISFGMVIPFFITQLLAGFVMGGAILALHAGVAINLTTIAGITSVLVTKATLATIWGGVWAVKNGLTTFINQRRARLSYADRVKKLLEKEVGNETNEARFNRLQHSFDKKIAHLKTLKTTNPAAYQGIKKQLVGWKQWSATNHHYHEKQREKATPWTRVKQVLNRGFEVFGGSQTGILITRVLFIFGCVCAAALAGAAVTAVSGVTFGLAPIIFTVMAGVAGGLLGGNRLLKYHMRSRQEHRKNFLNTFDQRVKFLEQKNEELDKVLGVERAVAANAPAAPAPEEDQAPGVPVAAEDQALNPAPDIAPAAATTERTTEPMQHEIINHGKPLVQYAKHARFFQPAAEPIAEERPLQITPSIAACA